MIDRERTDGPGVPEEPARSVVESSGAGGEADSAEPAGDQDPAAEAERTEQTDRLRSVEAEPASPGGAPSEADAETEGPRREHAGPESVPEVPHGEDAERETGDEEHEEEASGDEPEDPLARAEAQRDEYLALAQRTQADFENYRRRAAKEIAAAGAREKAALVREVLPVVDNLERALDSATEGGAGLAEGVKLVLADLIAVLERNGVESIEPAGERFDPMVHEALSTRAENGAEAGMVLDVVQKGYRLNSTVLRPARVVVAS